MNVSSAYECVRNWVHLNTVVASGIACDLKLRAEALWVLESEATVVASGIAGDGVMCIV